MSIFKQVPVIVAEILMNIVKKNNILVKVEDHPIFKASNNILKKQDNMLNKVLLNKFKNLLLKLLKK